MHRTSQLVGACMLAVSEGWVAVCAAQSLDPALWPAMLLAVSLSESVATSPLLAGHTSLAKPPQALLRWSHGCVALILITSVVSNRCSGRLLLCGVCYV